MTYNKRQGTGTTAPAVETRLSADYVRVRCSPNKPYTHLVQPDEQPRDRHADALKQVADHVQHGAAHVDVGVRCGSTTAAAAMAVPVVVRVSMAVPVAMVVAMRVGVAAAAGAAAHATRRRRCQPSGAGGGDLERRQRQLVPHLDLPLAVLLDDAAARGRVRCDAARLRAPAAAIQRAPSLRG